MTEYATEYRKGSTWSQNPDRDYLYMECKLCGAFETTAEDSIAVTCHQCVIEMCDAPDMKTRKNKGRPSGWHFMTEFIDQNGNVYFKGVEQPKLKGTLSQTVVEKKLKYTKKQKEEYMQKAALKVNILKKELKDLRWKKDKKAVMQKIKNYSKIMNGKVTEQWVAKLFS